jgi:hypothetical protein
MKTRTDLVAIGLMALVSVAQAANPPASLVMIPPQINYQGRLTTPANAPYNDSTHTIDLSLYPTASGGAKLWSERYSVQTRDGYFSVNLGSGGTGLLATNLPIWQVLWKTDGSSPDNFFMALTVRTDQNGAVLVNPAEATPRQQFLTAPFAYRAHQSVYATRADGLFVAPQGVQTASLSSTTNEIGVSAPLRVSDTAPIYANSVQAHGASPSLKLLAAGAPMAFGINYLGGISVAPTHASAIFIGSQANVAGAGTELFLDGRTVDIGTPSFTFNNRPMFVRTTGSTPLNGASSRVITVSHSINTSQYDVVVVGWIYSGTSPHIQSVFMNSNQAAATVHFSSTPSALSVTVYFLGIAKGLTAVQ